MSAIAELRKASGTMRCLECGKCSTLCPLSAFGDFSAARMIAIHDPSVQAAASSGTIDKCLTCGSCEVRCPQGVRFTEFVRGIRKEIPGWDRSPCPHGNALQASARLMAGSETVKRDLRWITEDLRVADEGEVALFVGCLPLFDTMFARDIGVSMIDIARGAIRLLNEAGIQPVVVDDERCCGHDLLWNGDPKTFGELARANASSFRDRGVKHIIACCAECVRTWKVDYVDEVPDYKPRVEHISEFVASQLETGTLVFGNGRGVKATYQDPCRLGRQMGVYEAPRRVISAVGATELVEMDLHGEDARCCGTAGFIHCDADSRRMQAERLECAEETGADILLTACPKCMIHFACARCEDGLRQREAKKIQVEDLTVFAARHLRPRDETAATSRRTPDGKEVSR